MVAVSRFGAFSCVGTKLGSTLKGLNKLDWSGALEKVMGLFIQFDIEINKSQVYLNIGQKFVN